MVFLLSVILVLIILTGPAQLGGRRRVVAVPARRKGLIWTAAWLRLPVSAVSRRRWQVVVVMSWLWTAVVRGAPRFRLIVEVQNGRQSFFLNAPVCLVEACFSLVEGAKFRQAAGWAGQKKHNKTGKKKQITFC